MPLWPGHCLPSVVWQCSAGTRSRTSTYTWQIELSHCCLHLRHPAAAVEVDGTLMPLPFSLSFCCSYVLVRFSDATDRTRHMMIAVVSTGSMDGSKPCARACRHSGSCCLNPIPHLPGQSDTSGCFQLAAMDQVIASVMIGFGRMLLHPAVAAQACHLGLLVLLLLHPLFG